MNFFDFLPEFPNLPDASCRDYEFPELFFPDSREQEAKSLPLVQAICAGCPARKECLEYALDQQIPHGIWAGTTPAMRGVKPTKISLRGFNTMAGNIRQLADKGWSHQEIARRLDIELSYVSTTLKRREAKLEGEIQSQQEKSAVPSKDCSSSSGFQR
jgi:hypothetical protein